MKNIKTAAFLCLILALISSCKKDSPEQIQQPDQLTNSGFENALDGWQIESANGFTSSSVAAKSGQLGLRFYAPSDSTPWNGKIFQTLQNLIDGNYTLSVYAEGLGSGMYLWADGGSGAVTSPIQRAILDSAHSLPLNTLNFTVTGGVAKVGFICINASPDTVQQPTYTLEAETALLNKAVVDSNQLGFTGKGFVDFKNNSGDFIEWTFNKVDSGSVALVFRFANGSNANRPLKLEVNNVVVNPNLSLPPTGSWTNWSTVSETVQLISGVNKIKLSSKGSNGPNIDHLTWRNIVSTPYFNADDIQLNKQ